MSANKVSRTERFEGRLLQESCSTTGRKIREKGKHMGFRPLHDRVLVRRVEAEEKTAGGIIIHDSAKEKPSEGEEIGRAHVSTPVTNAHLVCSILLEKQNH